MTKKGCVHSFTLPLPVRLLNAKVVRNFETESQVEQCSMLLRLFYFLQLFLSPSPSSSSCCLCGIISLLLLKFILWHLHFWLKPHAWRSAKDKLNRIRSQSFSLSLISGGPPLEKERVETRQCGVGNYITKLDLIFMVTPCINNIQHFNFQLTHTTLKNVKLLKHSKISKTAPTCFGLQGNDHQGATVST